MIIEKKPLNIRQEAFCKYYVSEEFFGNGVKSYVESHKPDESKKNWYKTARSVASVMLTNNNILNRINELLEEGGLNNEFIDKQLLFLATQNLDFTAKLGAIKEFNKLKTRITEKIEHSGEIGVNGFKELSTADLAKRKKELENPKKEG